MTAQLVEAPGGAVLWSITSQVELGEIFSLPDTLTRRIVDSFAVPLSAPGHLSVLRGDIPRTAKAYEFYLRANQSRYDPEPGPLRAICT